MAVWCELLIIDPEFESWEMKVDLKAVAKDAGVYKTVKEYGTGKPIREVQYSMTQAKKLIKTILDYADPEDFERIEHYWKDNAKLMKAWNVMKDLKMKKKGNLSNYGGS